MALHTALLWLARHSHAAAAASTDRGLSNVAGALSILCWFIVFTPQFWINYKRQSGESLSLTFLYIWLAGDLLNLAGATMDNLLLTMRILAWYYTLADTLLIAQVLYYRRVNRKRKELDALETGSEQDEHGRAPSSAPDLTSVLKDETASLLSKTRIHNGANVYDGSSSIVSNDKNYSAIAPTPFSPSTSSTVSFAKGPGLEQQQQQHHSLPFDPSAQRPLSPASEHAGTLHSRRRLRKLALVLLPILAAAAVLTYVKWRQCAVEERGQGNDPDKGWGWTQCHRGRGHGRGVAGVVDVDMMVDGVVLVDQLNQHRQDTSSSDLLPPANHGNSTSEVGSAGQGQGEEGTGGWLAQFFGWGSALLYLGSRIPQLYKNWRLQSCEGLSIMMFTFSVLGNTLFVASIFLNSTDPDYLWRNMPWWLGSSGTLVFDISIFAQFYMYRDNQDPTSIHKTKIDSEQG